MICLAEATTEGQTDEQPFTEAVVVSTPQSNPPSGLQPRPQASVSIFVGEGRGRRQLKKETFKKVAKYVLSGGRASSQGNKDAETESDGEPDETDREPRGVTVFEVLFEEYDKKRGGDVGNVVLVREDFQTRLAQIPRANLIQVIDWHAPDFNTARKMLFAFLKSIGALDSNQSRCPMRHSSKACLQQEGPDRDGRGFLLKPSGSRYDFASSAVFWTDRKVPKETDSSEPTEVTTIFRICPHIMQSHLASMIVYCPPKEGEIPNSAPQGVSTGRDRFFQNARAFGKALDKSKGELDAFFEKCQPQVGLAIWWECEGSIRIAYEQENDEDMAYAEQQRENVSEELQGSYPDNHVQYLNASRTSSDVLEFRDTNLDQLLAMNFVKMAPVGFLLSNTEVLPMTGDAMCVYTTVCLGGSLNAFVLQAKAAAQSQWKTNAPPLPPVSQEELQLRGSDPAKVATVLANLRRGPKFHTRIAMLPQKEAAAVSGGRVDSGGASSTKGVGGGDPVNGGASSTTGVGGIVNGGVLAVSGGGGGLGENASGEEGAQPMNLDAEALHPQVEGGQGPFPLLRDEKARYSTDRGDTNGEQAEGGAVQPNGYGPAPSSSSQALQEIRASPFKGPAGTNPS
uniref:Uncharacterized protein n=1 Tax=Chromera velia CCMP2878 TaxID=1169474 RepID=A0A0G4HQ59_9ALVE|eukprot:Cvel_7879.t1-p1 / transcript=Cvel_7879.t1 / gene=Cvel_7879 / organism=Chromera_velia_CCMP2878 / gene_product=hypothetical protein / transcript_product=hypothetical protein / location=Cvel_scaffold422:64494-68894(+) / protein_length=624 / sequence_SO=supercontig / SO=protein_coding / is_pseudo=false